MLSYAGPRTIRRKRSRQAILSLILSGYIVAVPTLLFFGGESFEGALHLNVGESVMVIMILSLPLAFISSFVFAIRTICGRE